MTAFQLNSGGCNILLMVREFSSCIDFKRTLHELTKCMWTKQKPEIVASDSKSYTSLLKPHHNGSTLPSTLPFPTELVF
jgi:hypothetical protein